MKQDVKKLGNRNQNQIKYGSNKTLNYYQNKKFKDRQFQQKFKQFKSKIGTPLNGSNASKSSRSISQNFRKVLPTPQIKNNKFNNNFYPYKVGSLIIQSQQQSYLQYHINTIQQKQLALKFLIDREKYGQNNVVIRIDYQKNICAELENKLINCLKILDCLGACTVCETTKYYSKYNNKDCTNIMIAAMLSDLPISQAFKIIPNFNKLL